MVKNIKRVVLISSTAIDEVQLPVKINKQSITNIFSQYNSIKISPRRQKGNGEYYGT